MPKNFGKPIVYPSWVGIKSNAFFAFDVVFVHKFAQQITKDNSLRLLEFLYVVISTSDCAEVAADTIFE